LRCCLSPDEKMSGQAGDLARRLARHAEAVCRHYLCNGKREGSYWRVGDVRNTPGRSLFVRLSGPDNGSGSAGRWMDGATDQYGDLLDLIALSQGLTCWRDLRAEASRFLGMPKVTRRRRSREPPARGGSEEAARRLFRAGRPILGTPAEAYLRARGISGAIDWSCLRFHPAVWYRADPEAAQESWPALLAAVTDEAGRITGLQRTWLDRTRPAKAPLPSPRRALGRLLGQGVRFGTATDVLAAGEGIETMLALKSVLPAMPMVAALSAGHLAALQLPDTLIRLYVARDRDAAGRMALRRLQHRGREMGVEIRALHSVHGDVNADLVVLGPAVLRRRLADQLAPADGRRFLVEPDTG
jgi:hypothetical protein